LNTIRPLLGDAVKFLAEHRDDVKISLAAELAAADEDAFIQTGLRRRHRPYRDSTESWRIITIDHRALVSTPDRRLNA
jgi:hypothetical protein